ncbi:MAG TPA: efflux RND transporter periplasmic adaptor subunit [Anaeromyxobacter sp.]|nr:efflux RND transporter periplasmic adaptor subunit [Anaeromyxobacter sp.]
MTRTTTSGDRRSPATRRAIRTLVIAACLLPSSARPGTAGPAAARVRAVRATAPTAASWVPASVAAAVRATVSTRVAASVRGVHVREGERVASGQPVISLSDADLRGALRAAEAGRAAAAAHERRIRALLAEEAAAPAQLEVATAQRAQAEAALAAARANLAYAQLRAPFAGTVQARHVEPGDLVGPGQPLLVLEGDALELVASLSEAEADGLAVGARLPFEADGARGSAVVTALTPGRDPVTHRRGLRARIEAPPAGLRSGAFARLQVRGGDGGEERAWVPSTALVERGDLTGVFVAAAGRAELRWISVGEAAGDGVWVRAGLRPGETVVDAPGALRDGTPVEVTP